MSNISTPDSNTFIAPKLSTTGLPVSKKFHAYLLQRVIFACLLLPDSENLCRETMEFIHSYIRKEKKKLSGQPIEIQLIFACLLPEVDRAMARSKAARERATRRRKNTLSNSSTDHKNSTRNSPLSTPRNTLSTPPADIQNSTRNSPLSTPRNTPSNPSADIQNSTRNPHLSTPRNTPSNPSADIQNSTLNFSLSTTRNTPSNYSANHINSTQKTSQITTGKSSDFSSSDNENRVNFSGCDTGSKPKSSSSKCQDLSSEKSSKKLVSTTEITAVPSSEQPSPTQAITSSTTHKNPGNHLSRRQRRLMNRAPKTRIKPLGARN